MELEITNIVWQHNEKENEELPKELKLNWNIDKWDYIQVSNWLTEYFKVKVKSLNIKESNDSGST